LRAPVLIIGSDADAEREFAIAAPFAMRVPPITSFPGIAIGRAPLLANLKFYMLVLVPGEDCASLAL
jgi:hypothetical protein